MLGYLRITIIVNNSGNICSRLRSDNMMSCLIHMNSREIFTIIKDTEGQNYLLQLIFISQTKLGNRHSWDSKDRLSFDLSMLTWNMHFVWNSTDEKASEVYNFVKSIF